MENDKAISETITLDDHVQSVKYLSEKDRHLSKVMHMVGPITYTPYGSDHGYRFLIHEIIEQMLSIKAGNKIFNRLEELCDGFVCPDQTV